MRAAVISRATAGSPSSDFPYPDRLIDHWIIQAAGAIIALELQKKEATSKQLPFSSYVSYSCQLITRSEEDCDGVRDPWRYWAELPHPLSPLPNPIVNMSVSGQPFDRVGSGAALSIPFGRPGPGSSRPAYWVDNEKIWFHAGIRNLERCKASFAMIPVNASFGSSCTITSEVVPHIDGATFQLVEDAVVTRVLSSMASGSMDVLESGSQPKPSERRAREQENA